MIENTVIKYNNISGCSSSVERSAGGREVGGPIPLILTTTMYLCMDTRIQSNFGVLIFGEYLVN